MCNVLTRALETSMVHRWCQNNVSGICYISMFALFRIRVEMHVGQSMLHTAEETCAMHVWGGHMCVGRARVGVCSKFGSSQFGSSHFAFSIS